jgi:hypothetical protein
VTELVLRLASGLTLGHPGLRILEVATPVPHRTSRNGSWPEEATRSTPRDLLGLDALPRRVGRCPRIGRSSATSRRLVESVLGACSPSGLFTEQLGLDVSALWCSASLSRFPVRVCMIEWSLRATSRKDHGATRMPRSLCSSSS